ncbi:MAG: c-type cytochrome [Pseudohongiellaceae bacterium]
MKKFLFSLLGIAASAAIVSGVFSTASAQDEMTPQQRAEAAGELRHGLFELLRFNLGPIIAMAQGAPFDAELAERNARRIAAIAPMIPDVFAEDTRNFTMHTHALDIIWEDMDDFRDKAQALVDNANAFADIAAGGDRAATMGAVRSLGGSCGNCHDTYREEVD